MFKHALLQMEIVEEEGEVIESDAIKPLEGALQEENAADVPLNTLSAFTEWQADGFVEEETSVNMPSLEDVAPVLDESVPASEEEKVQENASVEQESVMPLIDLPEIEQTEEIAPVALDAEKIVEADPVIEIEPVVVAEPVIEPVAEPVAEPAVETLSKKELKKLQKEAAKQEKRKKKEGVAAPDATVESEASSTDVEASEVKQGVDEDVE